MKQLPRSTGVLVVSLLLAVSAGAAAREVRMQGPNGNGGTCPEATIDEDVHAPTVHRRATTREKAKATPMLRSASGGDGGNTARPRWHSILPGMFR